MADSTQSFIKLTLDDKRWISRLAGYLTIVIKHLPTVSQSYSNCKFKPVLETVLAQLVIEVRRI